MSVSPPIGVVTRNRVAYLDVTLRSLSATDLPAEQALRVYDDASDDPATLQYLYGAGEIKCPRNWPLRNRHWEKLGLGIVNEHDLAPQALSDRVVVEKLNDQKLGVVNASCRAICRLFHEFPAAPGVFLLQDDEVFNRDWYRRMLSVARGATPGGPLGALAGCRLNYALSEEDQKKKVFETRATTAQCLYVTRPGFLGARAWFAGHHEDLKEFDNLFCNQIRLGQHTVCLVNPFVCQHIGVVSLVRPGLRWTRRGRRGRIGLAARPPFVMNDVVNQFR